MKTTTKTTPAALPPAASATPTLDATLPLVIALYGPELRWTIEGWAAHIRPCRHERHALNSWKKHRGSFPECFDGAKLLTLARMVDFGLAPDAAGELLHGAAEATTH